jgi:hypothetical protein
MPEVPCPGKDHGNTVPVTSLNGKAVVYRAAILEKPHLNALITPYPTRTYNKNRIPLTITYGARVKFRKLKTILPVNANIKNRVDTIL